MRDGDWEAAKVQRFRPAFLRDGTPNAGAAPCLSAPSRLMAGEEEGADVGAAVDDHEVLAAGDGMVDVLLEVDGEDGVAVAVDADEVGVMGEAVPEGGLAAGPADEGGIGLLKHDHGLPAGGIEAGRGEGQAADELPGEVRAEKGEAVNEGMQVGAVGAGGDEGELGDGQPFGDLAGHHAAQGDADEAVARTDAVFLDEKLGVVGEAAAGGGRTAVFQGAGGKGKVIPGVEGGGGAESGQEVDGHGAVMWGREGQVSNSAMMEGRLRIHRVTHWW